MSVEEILKKIVFIIKNYLSEDYKILLFGSLVKGDALNTSDIDVGILGKDVVPRDTMAQILEKIDEIPTLRSVDIVDFQAKSKEFRENVLKYAKILN